MSEREKDLFERIKVIIQEKLEVDEEDISESTRFKDDLDADSLDLFELAMELEDVFDIEIPSEELGKLKSVSDVLNYLQDKGVK